MKMLLGLDGFSYKERPDRLFSLEQRRLKSDLMDIMRGIDKLDDESLQPRVRESKARGQ